MERQKNGPLVLAVVLAIAAGLVWFGARNHAHKSGPQGTTPAAVTAPAAPAAPEAPVKKKQEEKKANDNDVIIG